LGHAGLLRLHETREPDTVQARDERGELMSEQETAFSEGVAHALGYLADVFGSGVYDTDLAKDYTPELWTGGEE